MHPFSLSHTVPEIHYLSGRDEQIVHRMEVLSNEAHRHSQGGAQGGDAHAHSALPDHLGAQVNVRLVPFLTARTPTLVQLVLGDLHRRGRRQLYHLAALGQLVQALTGINELLESLHINGPGYYGANTGRVCQASNSAPLFSSSRSLPPGWSFSSPGVALLRCRHGTWP